jgi:lipopolysaccharide/colanic/teichoic acid biosynthesis glycosyltransferase
MSEYRDRNNSGIASRFRNPISVSAPTPSGQESKTDTLYLEFGKRTLDVIFSCIALMLLAPLFLIVAVVIRLDSSGPILFLQERVGRGGKVFLLIKFRSMVNNAPGLGPGITVSQDKRVTRFGHILRSWKLDELPQLWNVLVGEMSLVGPRPELPVYVREYTAEQRQVLQIRPGVTDPASLRFRNESEILGQSQNPEKFYREEILPEKLSLNLKYLREVSFKNDLSVILSTLWAVATESSLHHVR